jgi:predicted HTH domain antitoxin
MKNVAKVAELSPLELKKKISLAEAAELNGVSLATFRRSYPHLLHRIGKRRLVIALGDALNLPPPSRG